MAKVKEWIEVWEESPMECGKKVKLTGRWKIKFVNERDYLYLEVKGFLSTRWVNSDYLEVQKHLEILYECKE